MAREQITLDSLVISANARASSSVDLHRGAGAVEVLTIYTPLWISGERIVVEVSHRNEDFVPLIHKGFPVEVSLPSHAYTVPVPACRRLRVISDAIEVEDRTFHVVALLEVG